MAVFRRVSSSGAWLPCAAMHVMLTVALISAVTGALAASEAWGAIPDLTTAIERVAKQNIPAVVHIEVTERREVANPFPSFGNDPFFRYFFGSPNLPKKFEREVKGLGSGMIIDVAGHILTNNHVVGGATKIRIQLADGRIFPPETVKLIGTDPKTDLAVLRITAKEPFPFVTFGDSDKMEVGQWVVAIGHPRGLDQTVTQGIISAKHRRGIGTPSSYQDFLQTDAAINPGNSGGPLLNLYGEVIGVNAAISSKSGGSEGIGFAIPSTMAVHVSRELIAHGKVERGWIGISMQDLTPELARTLALETRRGALIADVVAGSPAAEAGVLAGDVVVAYGGKAISDAASLRNELAKSRAGERVKLTVIREGKSRDISVIVATEQEAGQTLADALESRYGLSVRAVGNEDIAEYGLQSKKGAVVTGVDPDGVCSRAGIEVGDIIVKIGKRTVESPEFLAALLGALPARQKITAVVVNHRTGRLRYVQFTTP